MKILLGLYEISNYLQHLKKGFDALGIPSDIVIIKDYLYGLDETLIAKKWDISLARLTFRLYRKYRNIIILKQILALFSVLARIILFIRCLATYDVFIFTAYSNFLGFKELPILKFFHKKVIFQVVGSDFRPSYLDGYIDRKKNLSEIYQLTLETKKRVEVIEKYASYIISFPSVSHFQTLPYIDYRYFGLPTDYSYIQVSNIPQTYHKKQSIKIIHAPTNQLAKGSPKVIEVVNVLKKKYDIEFVLLFNVTNQEVLYHIATSDFAIDQLYAGGGHMARFSTEAAFFKKPVIVTGYGMSYYYSDFQDKEKIPPLVSGEPQDLENLVVRLIEDEAYRKEMGERAYSFVTTQWSPAQIASQFVALIKGNIPEKWWINPLLNEELWFYGRNKQEMYEFLKAYLQECGEEALLMEHNLKLKENLLKFSSGES